MSPDGAFPSPTADFCEMEPIRFAGHIQPHGVLLCVDADAGTVLAASTNADTIPALAGAIHGRHLTDVWPALAELGKEGTALLDGHMAAIHTIGRTTFIEIEPIQSEDAAPPLAVWQLGEEMDRLRRAETLEYLTAITAQAIRHITGMERVLIYRFTPEGHGEVVGESKVADWQESFIGFHFPSDDIPRQARALYLINPTRFTPQRDYDMVAIVPGTDPRDGQPFDLTRCQLRSLSPVHRLYQENLGVDGAMSVSIINEGRLWGLVVGHHRRPHRVAIPARHQVAAIATALSMRLTAAETAEERDARARHVTLHAKLLEQIAGADDFIAPLVHGEVKLTDIFFASSGAAVVYRDARDGQEHIEVRTVGEAPDDESVLQLTEACRPLLSDGVFATDHAASIHPPFASHAPYASGFLALTVGEEGRHMIVWFRPEIVRTTVWGGATPAAVAREKQAGNYLPRRSFARWVEERRGHSRPWPAWKIAIAHSLRTALNDVILRQMRTIRQLNLRLEESDQAKSKFLAHMSHELRTPLNAVIGFSEMLEMGLYGALADRQRENVGLIREAGVHLLELINDVLDLSKIQAGKMDLQPAVTDLGALSERILVLMRGMAREHGILMTGDHLPDVPQVSVDERLTKQMLLNLLSNALKFTPNGGSVTVSTRLRPDGGVTLAVSDTGIGIAEDKLAHVLEPFRQATVDPTLTARGTGLGLPIVKSLIELHGGAIRLHSRLGIGTTVSLDFPPSASQ